MSLSLEHIYSMLTVASSVIILTLGFLLSKIRLDRFQELRKVRWYLSLSYFILGLTSLVTYAMGENGLDQALLLLTTIGVASFQSLLFTIVHVVLLRVRSIGRMQVLGHLGGIALMVAILFILNFNGLVSESVLIIAAIVMYLAQQVYYVSRFDKNFQDVLQRKDRLNEKGEVQLRSVQYSFYGALSVGLFSLLAAVGGLVLYIVFIIVYTAFYVNMVIMVYNSRFVSVSSCVQPEVEPVVLEPEPLKEENFEVKEKIDRWVEDKGYLQNDLSVDEMAALLGTDRRTLRNFFRTQIKTDFRTWRAQLRIEEAKKLLLSHPDTPVSQIGEMVGYNHRSNFFTQFTKITGENPTVWREEHLQH